ncbi:MAG: hypothetical protein AAB213_04575, partial [Candidatus Omnitrophota bacterium]
MLIFKIKDCIFFKRACDKQLLGYAKPMETSLPTELFAVCCGLGLARFARHCVGHFACPNSLQTFAKKFLIVGLKNLPLLLRHSIDLIIQKFSY